MGTGSEFAVASGTFTASGGNIRLYQSGRKAAGNKQTIAQMKGSADFYINTDIKNGTADQITITSAADSGKHFIGINYDPCYEAGAGKTAAQNGKVQFATVPDGTTFTAKPTEYGAYIYTDHNE